MNTLPSYFQATDLHDLTAQYERSLPGGALHRGPVDEAGRPHGTADLAWPADNAFFVGTYVHGRREGAGVSLTPSWRTTGIWHQGQPQRGTVQKMQGSVMVQEYEGELTTFDGTPDGALVRHGEGRAELPPMERLEGRWAMHVFVAGTQTLGGSQGLVCKGSFDANRRLHGKGALRVEGKGPLCGAFHHGEPHGPCTLRLGGDTLAVRYNDGELVNLAESPPLPADLEGRAAHLLYLAADLHSILEFHLAFRLVAMLTRWDGVPPLPPTLRLSTKPPTLARLHVMLPALAQRLQTYQATLDAKKPLQPRRAREQIDRLAALPTLLRRLDTWIHTAEAALVSTPTARPTRR